MDFLPVDTLTVFLFILWVYGLAYIVTTYVRDVMSDDDPHIDEVA